jgi:hypothetical protein
MYKSVLPNLVPICHMWQYTFYIFFWCDLPLLDVFIIFVLFCHQVVHFIHLVFRRTRELNSRPRTMAQTVSPQRSPLDQGASSPMRQHTIKMWRQTIVQKYISYKNRHTHVATAKPLSPQLWQKNKYNEFDGFRSLLASQLF